METEISVATRVGTTGRYTFSLDRSAGESPTPTAVWLKDYHMGIVTNLMEEDYTTEIAVGCFQGVGETPTLPEASASVALVGAKDMVTAERVFARLGAAEES